MPQSQTQSDPWAEAAKNYKPSADSGSAPAGGNDDWKIWQQGGDDTPEQGTGVVNGLKQGASDLIGGITSLPHALAHPIDTINAMSDQQSALGDRAAQDFKTGHYGNAVWHGIDSAIPVLGPMDAALTDQYQGGDKSGAMARGVVNALPYALPHLAGKLNIGERMGGYKSPVIDPALQSASKLAKSIRPPGGIAHGFEQDLATNMPLIKAFANESGNPLHSQWEGATAARGLAQKGLEHFNTKFLEPNAMRTVQVSDIPDYQGTNAEGMTSIGDINKRLSDINDMLRPSGNAKTMGAEMTAQQRLGLGAEAGKLRQILYDKLGEASGVAPEQIKGMREGYGQQFGIADTIDAARRARLGQIGAGEEGSSVPLSKSGILEKVFTKARGGQQYLADSNFRRAAGKFDPTAPNYPEPMAKSPDAAAANQEAAQREFVHQNFLDQLAKDSAAQRSQAATAYRTESKAAQGEGLRARSRANARQRDSQ